MIWHPGEEIPLRDPPDPLIAALDEAVKSSSDHKHFNPERCLEVLREQGYDVARWRPRDELPTDLGEILVKARHEDREPHHRVVIWNKPDGGWTWLETNYNLKVLGWMELSP